jgi:hypothetical protein
MLHYYKVPQRPVDEFTLRKFARGNDVEQRIVQWVEPKRYQEACSYRGVAGIADMVLEYPIEIKSTTNMAFKYKAKEGPSLGHKLQGELYAKALGYDKFAIAYVASDDYRVLCFEEEVTGNVDKIIDEYEAQVATGQVPVFVAREKWHEKEDYNPYFEWMKLDDKGIADKLSSMGINITLGLPL